MFDGYDRRIISALRSDGRMSWTKLASIASLSASACQRRVESLVRSGLIKKFTLQLDDVALGNEVRAFVAVNVERHETARAESLREAFLNHEQVQSAHMVSGGIDFMLEVVCSDLEGLAHFLDDELLCMPGVRDATSSIVLRTIKQHEAVLGSA